VFFYTTNLAVPYEAAAFVLHCFDDRFRPVFEAFIRHVGFAHIDPVSVAGGGEVLATPKAENDRAFLLREIAQSRTLHQSKRVLVFTHTDCGAYGGAAQFQGDEEAEFIFHCAEHGKARAFLTTVFPDMLIEMYFLDTHGVYRIG
jgi:hypothetical protein